MGGVGCMVCQDFLVREAYIHVLVGGAVSLPDTAMKCPVMSFEVSMCLV